MCDIRDPPAIKHCLPNTLIILRGSAIWDKISYVIEGQKEISDTKFVCTVSSEKGMCSTFQGASSKGLYHPAIVLSRIVLHYAKKVHAMNTPQKDCFKKEKIGLQGYTLL